MKEPSVTLWRILTTIIVIMLFIATFYGFMVHENRMDYIERHAEYLQRKVNKLEAFRDSVRQHVDMPTGNED